MVVERIDIQKQMKVAEIMLSPEIVAETVSAMQNIGLFESFRYSAAQRIGIFSPKFSKINPADSVRSALDYFESGLIDKNYQVLTTLNSKNKEEAIRIASEVEELMRQKPVKDILPAYWFADPQKRLDAVIGNIQYVSYHTERGFPNDYHVKKIFQRMTDRKYRYLEYSLDVPNENTELYVNDLNSNPKL